MRVSLSRRPPALLSESRWCVKSSAGVLRLVKAAAPSSPLCVSVGAANHRCWCDCTCPRRLSPAILSGSLWVQQDHGYFLIINYIYVKTTVPVHESTSTKAVATTLMKFPAEKAPRSLLWRSRARPAGALHVDGGARRGTYAPRQTACIQRDVLRHRLDAVQSLVLRDAGYSVAQIGMLKSFGCVMAASALPSGPWSGTRLTPRSRRFSLIVRLRCGIAGDYSPVR